MPTNECMDDDEKRVTIITDLCYNIRENYCMDRMADQ